MQNETKLSQEKINSLLNMLKNGNINPQSLKNTLSDSQKQQVNSILSNPEKLQQLLSSPQAQSLMEKLKKTTQGEPGNGASS